MRRTLCLVPLLLIVACAPPPQSLHAPLHVEAGYRLLFNDTLVGNALFILQIGSDGGYRLEAFTTPAGEMADRAGHEVLESSIGSLHQGEVRPSHFEHSVLRGDEVDLIELQFDWEHHRLALGGPEPRTLALLPGTHDRLSYLLAARALADAGSGRVQLQVASLEASEETVLEVVGREVIEVPLGHYDAVAVRRVTPNATERRMLWFDEAQGPLPLRVLYEYDGNVVEMRLADLSRRPSDPR